MEKLFHSLLWDWLKLDEVLARPRYGHLDATAVQGVIETAERFSAEMLRPTARAMDLEPPSLGDDGTVRIHPASAAALRGMAENGFFATVFDETHGGLQLPNLVHAAVIGLAMSGCVATASYLLLTIGNARLIVEKGTPSQIEAFAEPQIRGETMGTMCLSEPHAGSMLATITTRALADGEDSIGRRFRIRGAKMWISGADHDATANIVHLVLAKIPAEDGSLTRGNRDISLFIVPKILPSGEHNDVAITGLNHKLGQKALPNAAMAFGEGRHEPDGAPGAIGWLLGEPGDGLAQMFQMMNDARIAVGMGGAMLALRGFDLSLDYARDRIQGTRKGRETAIIEHPDVKRMLLMQKSIAEGAVALVFFGARLLDDEQAAAGVEAREAAVLLALLTPVIKSWPAEFGQEALDEAMQVLGGAGYTIDHEVEKLYRDNRLNPIHEGTTGIQALDLLGRKLRRDGGAGFALFEQRVRATVSDAATDDALAPIGRSVGEALAGLAASARLLVTEPDEDWAAGVATPFMNAFGHVTVAWLWLDQAVAASRARAAGTSTAWDEGRLCAMRYFVDCELPRIAQWLQPVERRSRVVVDMASDWF